jgi:hypothetical protein
MEYRYIAGFPGYRVGRDGTVWSAWNRVAVGLGGRQITNDWHVLKPRVQRRTGHLSVVLYQDGKPRKRFIHHLVLNVFVGPKPLNKQARHLNDIPTDNQVENLQWGTRLENASDRRMNSGYGTAAKGERHGSHKLTEQSVRDIRTSTETHAALAHRFGVKGELMSNRRTDEEKLDALIDSLADSVLEASDDEIIEELRMSGGNPDAEAARLKAMMLATVKAFRQRALETARAAYSRQIEQMERKQYAIPNTPAERRKLFSLFTQQPQFAQFVTAHYRDLENLTDNDIETYLEDLAELGILEKLERDKTDGE